MKIEKITLDKINPAPYNPRKDLQSGDAEYEKIKRSITEFDLVEPLVVNKQTGNLVGGHQRLKVLKELGKTDVEVVIVDLPISREKALNIALNKAQGEWDLPKLKDLLLEIDTGEFDIGITGFDEKEIEDLMNQLYTPDENEKDDDVPDVPEEPITKKGDLYKLGEHRLLCGDATSVDDVERLMDGQKADMVFTDPPYGMFLDADFSDMVGIGKGNKYNNVIGDHADFSNEFINTVFANFNYCKEIFLWGADYYAEVIPDRNDGSFIVWDKMRGGEGVKDNYDKMFGSNFELCWSKAKHKRAIARVLWKGIFGLSEEDTKKRVHPTQKPILLCEWFLEKFSKRNNLIADIFGGSGSTLIACQKLNRKCFMMELDEHYCDVIVKRWEDYTGKKAELVLDEIHT